jgi:hypothetical protein
MSDGTQSRGNSGMVNMQKELLDVYVQASGAWLARVKSEVDLWSELAAKLSATRSMPEALESYQKFVTQGIGWQRRTDADWSRTVRRSRKK